MTKKRMMMKTWPHLQMKLRKIAKSFDSSYQTNQYQREAQYSSLSAMFFRTRNGPRYSNMLAATLLTPS